MANGIYLDINSADDLSEMTENRGKMHKIKVWTEWTMIIEIIVAAYLIFASFLGFMALPAGLLYICLLTKKNPKICRTGTLVHILLMIIVVLTAGMYMVQAFTADTPSSSFLPSGLAAVFTSLPTEELANSEGNAEIMKLLIKSLRTLTTVNFVCAVVATAAPVWMNYKEYEYCLMHEELKECIGYPHFHPDIALLKAAEEISEKKEHKIQTDTDSAVTNAQLMKNLRDQNVDFSDTEALFSAITANARPETKTTSASGRTALDRVDAMLSSAKNRDKYTTSAMNTLTGTFSSSVMKTAELFGVKKETANAKAMNELVKEAERLRAQKANSANGAQNQLTERKISTWGDTPENSENITELSDL